MKPDHPLSGINLKEKIKKTAFYHVFDKKS